MYYLPQEIEVWYIIPAIRRELSKELVKKHKMTLEMVGNALGVSKAAISQYLSKKRGGSVKLAEKIKNEIKISANSISENKTEAFHEIMRLLRICKTEGVSCISCRKFNKEVLDHCKMKPHHYDIDLK
ncbi:transcriptional regulator [Candidatus Pacearchaeota archaeon]|nr:transcriptional regulator [Candidatus Pacearchaeota archaeon]